MKQYLQLSQDERYEIYTALKSKSPISTVARELGRSCSTIYREIKRNIDLRGLEQSKLNKWQQSEDTVLTLN